MSLWTEAPTLAGARVTLRPMTRDDRDAIVAASADGDAGGLFYTTAPGADSIDRWLDATLQQQAFGRVLPFVIVADGRVIGATRYMRMSPANRRLEIGGTFYAASVRRSGVNTEAKMLLLTHAFEAMECLCVQFRTDWFNRASQTAIERLGAKRDGVLRNHIVMPDGRVRDTVCYSITHNEWPGVQANLRHLTARDDRRQA
jgi:RimJ/RimL family protein N-acetyltransferase